MLLWDIKENLTETNFEDVVEIKVRNTGLLEKEKDIENKIADRI